MTATNRYKTTGDLPAALPVLPLLGCILLPRASLPLNIFEPRYLAMISDVIAGDRMVGIIQPASADDQPESPLGKAVRLRGVGCAGRLTAFEELEDGRMAIILAGVCRFTVGSEISTTTPYRKMQVSYDRFAQDLQGVTGEDEVDRAALLGALRSYLAAKRLQADWQAIEQAGSELLINALSLNSPYGPEEKQALLEAPTLKERAGVLLTLSQMEIAAGPGGDVRRRLQ